MRRTHELTETPIAFAAGPISMCGAGSGGAKGRARIPDKGNQHQERDGQQIEDVVDA